MANYEQGQTTNANGGALSVTAAVAGNDCQVFATGLAGKTINWSMLIESESLVVSP